MVRVAHLSDTHLGFTQYNIGEREQDVYDVLEEIADKILEERADILVHTGDLFDSWRPATQAYYAFKSFLNKLDGKVQTFAILGDHDSPKRQAMFPHKLFDDRIQILGIGGADHQVLHLNGQTILVAGISNLSRRYRGVLLEELKKLDRLAADHKVSVLALHQAIDKFLPFEEVFELRLDEVPRNFRYCAMGHMHARLRASHGNGELAYAGSTEIFRKSEIDEWKKFGKGFYIVDIEDEVAVTKINLDKIRPQLSAKLGYANFEKELERLATSLGEVAKLPIAHIVVEGRQVDRQRVHEMLNQVLAGKCLRFLPQIIEEEEKSLAELKRGFFNTDEALKEYLKHEELAALASELLKFLKHGDLDEAKKVADDYFLKVKNG